MQHLCAISVSASAMPCFPRGACPPILVFAREEFDTFKLEPSTLPLRCLYKLLIWVDLLSFEATLFRSTTFTILSGGGGGGAPPLASAMRGGGGGAPPSVCAMGDGGGGGSTASDPIEVEVVVVGDSSGGGGGDGASDP